MVEQWPGLWIAVCGNRIHGADEIMDGQIGKPGPSAGQCVATEETPRETHSRFKQGEERTCWVGYLIQAGRKRGRVGYLIPTGTQMNMPLKGLKEGRKYLLGLQAGEDGWVGVDKVYPTRQFQRGPIKTPFLTTGCHGGVGSGEIERDQFERVLWQRC
jgi:hypothetical protein